MTQVTATARTETASAPAGKDLRARLLDDLPVKERRLSLAGVLTPVLEGGDGPPIVLLHGPGEHAPKWLRIIPALVTGHRVIAPDLPGHGDSAVPDQPLDAARVMNWLDALIEQTCAAPPVLVGQIVGGAIAARFAITRGERISHLVLCDALGLTPFQPTPEFGAALNAFLEQPDPAAHDHLWRHCAFDLDGLRAHMGGAWKRLKAYNLDRARDPDAQRALQALMAEFGMPAIPADELARISVPTTLIWGRHDLATPLAVAEAASARFGWPLEVIERAADDPPIEQPEAFVDALRAALAATATRSAWDAIAAGYDTHVTPTHLWLANQGLRRAGVGPGTRFVDVAAGTGALSITAARHGAEVLATDLSPGMLEQLQTRARREGLDKVATRAMDGHALALEDNSFDVCGSQFGVMLFPDMPRGIREMTRVTRPGGRVLVTVYGDPRAVEFIVFFVRGVQAAAPDFAGLPLDPPPLPFQLRDPARLQRELEDAGLHDVRVDSITEQLEFRSGDALWDWLVSSNPIVESVLAELSLSAARRAAVRQELESLVRERAGSGDVAVLTNPINIGVGTR